MRGEITQGWRGWVNGLRLALQAADANPVRSLRPACPAFLPLMWERRALRCLITDPAAILGGLERIDRPFDGLRLFWRASTGRW